MLFHDHDRRTGLERFRAAVVETPPVPGREFRVRRVQPFVLDDRQLPGCEDSVSEQEANQFEGFRVVEHPAFQRLAVGDDLLEILLAAVERRDGGVLQSLPDVLRVLFHDGNVSGESQIVADEYLRADGDADGHALVVAVPEADGQPQFGVGALEDVHPEKLVAVPGQSVLLFVQGEAFEDILPDGGQGFRQMFVRHGQITVGRLRDRH